MGNSYPVVVETQEYKLNLDRTQTEGIIYHLITPTAGAPVLSPYVHICVLISGKQGKVSLSPS